MHPPSHHNTAASAGHLPPPPSTPPTPRSQAAGSVDVHGRQHAPRAGSPVANDRLFKSLTAAGQAVKSMSASGGLGHHADQGDDSDVDLDHVHMSITQLLRHTAPFTQYSLSDISSRKKRQLASKGVTSFDESLKVLLNNSKIMASDRSVAERVFFTLPFFAQPPQVKLLYSTDLHNRGLGDLFQKTDKVS